MGRRTLLLIASILIAAVGTALIGIYVRGADARAQANEKQIEVLVAKEDIGSGTTVKTALQTLKFEPATYPRKLFRPGMYTGADALTTFTAQTAGKTAITKILKGQPIQEQMFGDQSQASSGTIAKGRMAVAVEMTDPQRAAGLLAPGSTVTIFSTPDQKGASGAAPTDVLLEGVKVIAIGENQINSADTPTAGGTTAGGTTGRLAKAASNSDEVPSTVVTLDLNKDQAGKVINADANGDLYFGITQGLGSG
jgi:pilus assembly protein CpaB